MGSTVVVVALLRYTTLLSLHEKHTLTPTLVACVRDAFPFVCLEGGYCVCFVLFFFLGKIVR